MQTDDALERYFAAFAMEGGTPTPSAEEIRAVLDLTRVVAHTGERHYAPLAAYLAGLAAATEDPQQRADRVRALVTVAQKLRL